MMLGLAFWLGFFVLFEVLIFVQRLRGEMTWDEHRNSLKGFGWALSYLLVACLWEVGFYLLLKPVSASEDLLKTYLFLLLFVFVIPTAWLTVVWNIRREEQRENMKSKSAI